MAAPSKIAVAFAIAGSDPSGGAGIQADLKTFSALGVYGAAAVTALTAQNTRGVRGVHVPPAEFVGEQVDLVFEDLAVDAVKIGMLARAPIVAAVARSLRAHGARRVVLDPVLVAKSGARLLEDDGVLALKEELFPLADVITPNLPEAAALLGIDERDVLAAPESACRLLLQHGARAVLLKGGHAGGAYSEDLLWNGRELVRLPAKRVATLHTHGTGCTLSSAIAAFLARGEELEAAARAAKRYVTDALLAAAEWNIGHGQGPVHHFHAWW